MTRNIIVTIPNSNKKVVVKTNATELLKYLSFKIMLKVIDNK